MLICRSHVSKINFRQRCLLLRGKKYCLANSSKFLICSKSRFQLYVSLSEPFFEKWPLLISFEQTLSSFKIHSRLFMMSLRSECFLFRLGDDFKLHWCSLMGTKMTHFEFWSSLKVFSIGVNRIIDANCLHLDWDGLRSHFIFVWIMKVCQILIYKI